jgi:chromosome segregation protein
LSPERGLEAALAAALGDDLDAALDGRAPAFWAGREAPPPVWPEGATPLTPLIAAPPQLAARLAFTALADRADGPMLQGALPPGARLVSRQGDLWRWDGFTATAEAQRPAQVRLEHKSRLAAIEADLAFLGPTAAGAREDQAKAARRLADAEQAARLARAAPRGAELDAARAREAVERLEREGARRDARAQSLDETIARFDAERAEAASALATVSVQAGAITRDDNLSGQLAQARATSARARETAAAARAALDAETRGRDGRARRLAELRDSRADWTRRFDAASRRQEVLAKDRMKARDALDGARDAPAAIAAKRLELMDQLELAQSRRSRAADALAAAETARAEADRAARAADALAADTREARASLTARLEATRERVSEHAAAILDATGLDPKALGEKLTYDAIALPTGVAGAETHLAALERDLGAIGAVNLRAEEEAEDLAARIQDMRAERADLTGALSRLRQAIDELNAEGRERLLAAFQVIDDHFRSLFTALFQGGQAELRLVESEDPLEAGLEILACPPGKRMAVMSLMSGGEQALTATALIFAVFLANPAPICVLDEVDAPLDDANVERFCNLLAEMRGRTATRFITITHNPLTMSRMDRLFGVTMRERGVSQLVSVDLRQAEALAAQ